MSDMAKPDVTDARGWLRVAFAVLVCVGLVGVRPLVEGLAAPVCANREGSPANPPGCEGGIGTEVDAAAALAGGVIFDDFRYLRPIGYSDATRSGPPNTLFGPNPWLEGTDLDNLSRGATARRAWYGHGWHDEYVAYPHLACPSPPCTDNSLFDGHGAEMITEPIGSTPGHLIQRYAAGSYSTRRLISLILTSGFAARTGTWVTRVRLPSFDGYERADGGVGVLLAPIWLKNSTEAWETRTIWPENTGGTNWWEANFEIWREPDGWQPYSDVHYTPPGFANAERFVSAGNSWFRYSNAVYPGAAGVVHPANSAFGRCSVVHRTPTSTQARTTLVDQTDCLDAMVGKANRPEFEGAGHPYVYFMIQHTGRETKRYIYVRSEDDHGRPTPSTRFQSLLLDQEGQINYVDAGFFSAQLEMMLYPNPSVARATVGQHPIDLHFDWFLYTPDTTISIRQVPDHARDIQGRLSAYNGTRPAAEQIWRLNTTGLALEAPRRAIDPWATCNPWRIEPIANWDIVVEKTDRNGETFFTAHLVRDAGHDLRRMFQSIEWTVQRNGRVVASIRNQGYTLQRGRHWGTDPLDITVRVTQTSPITHPPFQWHHDSSTECADGFGPATRNRAYRYNPVSGQFVERR